MLAYQVGRVPAKQQHVLDVLMSYQLGSCAS